jgi:excisionase family DNA binding protein
MTIPHPSPTPAGSVLDGDPRILIPLPEVAQRLGISRWQAYKLARSGRLPTTRLGARDLHVPAAVLRRIEQKASPQPRRAVRWRDPPGRPARPPCPPAGQP